MTDWKAVGTALLGSWPSQVASWGREAIAAYVAELEARGMTPDTAIEAIRSSTERFPPGAGELAQAARRDPERPTFAECLQQLYGPGGLFGFKRAGVEVSPWVQAFAASYGRERLRLLEIDHDAYGGAVRRDLERAYAAFLEATEGRELAQLVAPRRRTLGRFDPAAALVEEGS